MSAASLHMLLKIDCGSKKQKQNQSHDICSIFFKLGHVYVLISSSSETF